MVHKDKKITDTCDESKLMWAISDFDKMSQRQSQAKVAPQIEWATDLIQMLGIMSDQL
jgi:hypothetical protein